ncbi:MAG: metallopeptidase family protein [Polyangiaceae bacterium]|nr:metallopeptidase family protein [Polyangiaceae bacterium]
MPAGLGPFAQAFAILSAPGVLAEKNGAPIDVYSLALRDVHTLRALLYRSRVLIEDEEEFECENCGKAFRAVPSAAWQVGPFLDGELTDEELDAPFPFGVPQPIPRLILPAARRVEGEPRFRRLRRLDGSRTAETVTFAERSVADARALFETADKLFLGEMDSFSVTPALVVAMGIVALGSERRTRVMARALAEAPDPVWAAVVDHFLEAAYSQRLFAAFRGEECSCRNLVDVPLVRELGRHAVEFSRTRRRREQEPFPDLEAFESLVKKHAERVYAARGVRNIDLIVDDGVPHCDDGGEPLLGSYAPPVGEEVLGGNVRPEVRVYYRTFRSEYEADPTFDVEGEIRETIDHEVEHHLNYLAGEDPLDDEERAAIEEEELRIVGRGEMRRRERASLTRRIGEFLRVTWLLWVAMAVAAIVMWMSGDL